VKRIVPFSFAAAVLGFVQFAAVSADAQEPPRRLRGTIERIDGSRLSIKVKDGSQLTVQLKENASVVAVVKASLTDVKPGVYAGITGMPQPDGTQRALEVHLFPESMRGVGDGHRPWDLQPDSTMTNGNVEQQVAAVNGQTLKVKYKDGEKSITVGPQTEIVAFQPTAASDLKAGQKIFIAAATKLPDGSYEAARIAFGKDGLTPPM
jgi:Domain of unknown function (DUF5666)